jgi:hypothetical protein
MFVEVPGMAINGRQEEVALALPTVPQVCVRWHGDWAGKERVECACAVNGEFNRKAGARARIARRAAIQRGLDARAVRIGNRGVH